MKLSENTVNVLKNFSSINQNLLFEKGNTLRTMSTMKNILGQAEISESLPKEFGIYDLNELLGVFSLSKDAEINFDHDSYLVVNGLNSSVKYFYSDPSIIVSPPETFNPPVTDCTFKITESILTDVTKACAVLQLPDVVIRNEDSSVYLVATDLKNTTSHEYKVELNVDLEPVNFHFKVDNLKLISGDYKMHVARDKNVSHWVHDTKKIQYWIALEQTSGD